MGDFDLGEIISYTEALNYYNYSILIYNIYKHTIHKTHNV